MLDILKRINVDKALVMGSKGESAGALICVTPDAHVWYRSAGGKLILFPYLRTVEISQ